MAYLHPVAPKSAPYLFRTSDSSLKISACESILQFWEGIM